MAPLPANGFVQRKTRAGRAQVQKAGLTHAPPPPARGRCVSAGASQSPVALIPSILRAATQSPALALYFCTPLSRRCLPLRLEKLGPVSHSWNWNLLVPF